MSYHLPQGLVRGAQRYGGPRLNSRPVKRAVEFHGIPVSVEIEAGDTKTGVDEDGQPWQVTYSIPYGEIPGTRSLADGDGVDIYLGPDEDAEKVFVVHQLRRDGSHDEDKVMLQFGSASDAEAAYRDHHSGAAWAFGSMDEMTVDEFLNGYLASNRVIG